MRRLCLVILCLKAASAILPNVTETHIEPCEDPNAEFRWDNFSCVVTCSKRTLTENPNFCFAGPQLSQHCHCKQNYFLDESTGRCVPSENCPCPANQLTRFSSECANNCDTFQSCPSQLSLLRGQCWCNYDACRSKTGECILKESV